MLFLTSTGCYFGLNGVAAYIWTLLSEGYDEEAIIRVLVSHYEVNPAVAKDEVDRLLAEFLTEGLMRRDGYSCAEIQAAESQLIGPEPRKVWER